MLTRPRGVARRFPRGYIARTASISEYFTYERERTVATTVAMRIAQRLQLFEGGVEIVLAVVAIAHGRRRSFSASLPRIDMAPPPRAERREQDRCGREAGHGDRERAAADHEASTRGQRRSLLHHPRELARKTCARRHSSTIAWFAIRDGYAPRGRSYRLVLSGSARPPSRDCAPQLPMSRSTSHASCSTPGARTARVRGDVRAARPRVPSSSSSGTFFEHDAT